MSKFKIGQSVCDKQDGEIMEIVDYSEKTGHYIVNWFDSMQIYKEEDLIEPENYIEPEEQERQDKMDLILEKLDLILNKL
jgi:uncharacterized protein YodC (DUF2158 family)